MKLGTVELAGLCKAKSAHSNHYHSLFYFQRKFLLYKFDCGLDLKGLRIIARLFQPQATGSDRQSNRSPSITPSCASVTPTIRCQSVAKTSPHVKVFVAEPTEASAKPQIALAISPSSMGLRLLRIYYIL